MAKPGQHSGHGLPFIGQVAFPRPENPSSFKQPERPGAVALVGGEGGQQAGPQGGAKILPVGAHRVSHPHRQVGRVQLFNLFQLLQGYQRIVDHLLDTLGGQQVFNLVAKANDRHRLLERDGTGEHGGRDRIVADSPHYFLNQVLLDVYVVPPIGDGDFQLGFPGRLPGETQSIESLLNPLLVHFHPQHPPDLLAGQRHYRSISSFVGQNVHDARRHCPAGDLLNQAGGPAQGDGR